MDRPILQTTSDEQRAMSGAERSANCFNPKSKIQNPKSRAAFTLIELLLVIVIIGMLVALVSTAAVHVVTRARQAENTLTIDTLDQAIQNAKSQYGLYPPDCTNLGQQGGNTSTPSFGQTYRQNRIIAFFRKAFPRMTVTGYGPSTNSDPPIGTLQYLSQYAFGNTGYRQSDPCLRGWNDQPLRRLKQP